MHAHIGPPEQVIVEREASVSFIAALPDESRTRVLHEVRALMAATPELAGREAVSFPCATRAYWTVANQSWRMRMWPCAIFFLEAGLAARGQMIDAPSSAGVAPSRSRVNSSRPTP